MQTAQNTILVTGGGSGIGRGLAESFHRLGNQVIIAGRRREQLESVAAANPGMQSLTLDQSDAADIERFATEATQRHPDLNVLINNAGIQYSEDLTAGHVAEAEAMIITNLVPYASLLRCCRAAVTARDVASGRWNLAAACAASRPPAPIRCPTPDGLARVSADALVVTRGNYLALFPELPAELPIETGR